MASLYTDQNPMWYKNTSGQNILTFTFFISGCTLVFLLPGTKARLSNAEEVEIQNVILKQVFDYTEASSQNDTDYYFVGVAGSLLKIDYGSGGLNQKALSKTDYPSGNLFQNFIHDS